MPNGLKNHILVFVTFDCAKGWFEIDCEPFITKLSNAQQVVLKVIHKYNIWYGYSRGITDSTYTKNSALIVVSIGDIAFLLCFELNKKRGLNSYFGPLCLF